MKKKTVENKQSFPGGVFINCEGMFFFFFGVVFFHLLLYSSLNPAAETLISEKKWRYSWLEVLLRSAGTVVPWGQD